MAFPIDPLPIRAEMLIDGEWEDVTTDVRGNGDITISGGFAPEQSSISPSVISFNLDDRDGRYCDDNIASDLYGKLPINTPFRVSVEEATPFLRLANGVSVDPMRTTTWDGAWVETVDKPSIALTGDIDARIEIDPDTWRLGSAGQHLAGKFTTDGDNRSWAWVIQSSGVMRLYWSDDGTSALAAGTYADSTERVPATGRIALRVTIDVNNGAAGRTVTFYTSDSITGAWAQLGDAVVQAGATSLADTFANLTVGGLVDAFTGEFLIVTDATAGHTIPMAGRVHRFQFYNGIAGTLVADMNPAGQAEGTASWSDGLASPNTWTINGPGEITVADYRGYGEISEFSPDWDVTGRDVVAPIVASGIKRRLTQGAAKIGSAVFRNLSQFIGDGAVGYWPLEGGSQTVAAGNAVPGGPPAQVNNVQFGTDADFPGTSGVMTMSDSSSFIRGRTGISAHADQAFCIFYAHIPAAPGAGTVFLNWNTTGTARTVGVSLDATTYRATAYDAGGTSIGTTAGSFGTLAEPGQWLAFQVKLTKNGTGIDLDLAWYPLGTRANFFGTLGVTIASAIVGAPMGFSTPSGAGIMNVSFAHIMMGNRADWEYATAVFAAASVGYDEEEAAVRYLRVCAEEGVEARCVGWPRDSEKMGPQPNDTLSSILDECAAVDFALQYEARDMGAYVIRTRTSLYAQEPVVLDYAANHLSGSYRPVHDDRMLVNDVTLNRVGGSFATVRKETGAKSIDRIGRYDVAPSVNAYADARLPDLAGWMVGVGTWPDRRVPNLEMWLQRSPFIASATLTRQMRALSPGSRVSVTNNPVWVGSGTSDMLIRGFRETLKNRGQELGFSTVPYGPYDAIRYDDEQADEPRRYDVRTSTLTTSMTSGAVRAYVSSSSRRGFWSWRSCPYDVEISGQANTVIGATRPDSVTLADTSFESGDPLADGWIVGGGSSSLAGSTATVPYGTYAALMTVAGGPATASIRDTLGCISVVAGGTFQLKCWVRCSVSRNVLLLADWYNSVPTYLSSLSSSIAVVANTWTEIAVTGTAPANAVNAFVGLDLTGSPANGTLLYFKGLDMMRLDSRNGRQVLLLTRGAPTKALDSGAEVHIAQQRVWTL